MRRGPLGAFLDGGADFVFLDPALDAALDPGLAPALAPGLGFRPVRVAAIYGRDR